MSYWLVGLFIWIAPAVLLGFALLWVRYNTSPAANASSNNAGSVNATTEAEEMPPQLAVVVAAE